MAPPLPVPSPPTTRPDTARRWPSTLFDSRMGWPTRCAVCQGWSLQRLCHDCCGIYVSQASRCAQCALPMAPVPSTTAGSPPALPREARADARWRCGRCRLQPPAFDRTVAAVDYGYPWRQLVAALKYRDGLDLAPALAALLAQAIDRAGDTRPTLILPAPLSPARLQSRGYNQAWELARRLGRTLGIEARHDLLQRLLDAPTQAGLDRAARLRNLRGAFHAPPRASAPLRGAHVALVDDVMTTGATLNEAALALQRAGAARVDAWVLARTDDR